MVIVSAFNFPHTRSNIFANMGSVSVPYKGTGGSVPYAGRKLVVMRTSIG